MIDLRLLQTLRVLREQGTVTATARALHLSPSAVSAQLRQLAQQTGVEPLRPDGRRVRLTPAGEVLLHHADILCGQWEQARAELSNHDAEPQRTLHISGFATSIGPLLAPSAANLRRTQPPTIAHITERDTRDSYQYLLTGDIDIAVITPLPDSPAADDPRFDQRPLLDDYLDLVVPADHPLAGRRDADLADAATEAWISPHHDQDRLIQVLCAAAGFAPRLHHHADEWPAVLSLIGHGLGICLVPRLIPTTGHPDLVRVPIRGTPPYRRVLTCIRHGSHNQPPIATGLTALHNQAAAIDTPGTP